MQELSRSCDPAPILAEIPGTRPKRVCKFSRYDPADMLNPHPMARCTHFAVGEKLIDLSAFRSLLQDVISSGECSN